MYTPSEPSALALPDWPWLQTRVGFGMSRVLQWLASPANAEPAPAPAMNGSCASCWMDFGWGHGRSFFETLPRQPSCGNGAPALATSTSPSSWFIGIPGTALGFYLDTRLWASA